MAQPPGQPRGGLSRDWPALAAARHQAVPRLAFAIGGRVVGSIARAHLDSLRQWPQWLRIDDATVQLVANDATEALTRINQALRDAGLIRAWRDETYAIVEHAGAAPLALIERAAARFWGSLTFGAHANGYLTDANGRPTKLWIARRSRHKATDPGMLDNLVGGGVPWDQTPMQALVREGFEEAGLDAELMHSASPGRVLEVACDIVEGFMRERLHVFDLCLPAGTTPINQDGEVAELHCLPVAQAIALAASGEMTVDAALVTLDFALRHRLLPTADHDVLAPRLAELVVYG